ncbi:MAG: hypothetical protein M0P71_12045 [Melioribacteraceae bacterium]|jgi:hypothetical protein|nr:hypothetical protein [Melioribacteraceae bacterium]
MTKKTKFKISKIFGIIFLIFWQVETWYFIIRDGWHLKAITEAEKTCDGIASMFLIISCIFFFSILYDIVKLFARCNITSINVTNKIYDTNNN